MQGRLIYLLHVNFFDATAEQQSCSTMIRTAVDNESEDHPLAGAGICEIGPAGDAGGAAALLRLS